MGRELRGAVVVITGASSGIGRAAALEFADRGSRLVLAARGVGPLRETVGECEARGAEAIAVPTDVRDEVAVGELAEAAISRFGRIDVWVNNAGVIGYGRFEQVPSDVFRAVIETNLMGQVKRQPDRTGALSPPGAGHPDQPRVGVVAGHHTGCQRLRDEQVRDSRV
jgi:NAD(P)-dependent dehydrogenase (short-subunit alcohol dehydrogenase family)